MRVLAGKPDDWHELVASVWESDPDAIYLCDREGMFLRANQAFGAITGYKADDLIGEPIVSLAATEWEAQRWVTRYRRAAQGDVSQYDMTIKAKDGRHIALSIKDVPALVKGEVVGVFSVARDMSDQHQLENRLRYLAERDALTGLYNRAKFSEELRNTLALSRRYDTFGAILFIDLDEFKDINDSLGHEAGDRYLVEISEALRNRLRGTDVLARLGGDEFAVLLPHTSRDESGLVAQSLLRILNQLRVPVGGKERPVCASIGIVLYPDHGESAGRLMSLADSALYMAKRSGKNQYNFYTYDKTIGAEIDVASSSWRRRLLQAIDQDQLALYAQPILNLNNNTVCHYELLLQMKEDGHVVPSSAFMYSSERHGLVDVLDTWVIDQAIDILSRNHNTNGLQLVVNISGRSLVNDGMVAHVKRALTTASIDPSGLIFEITETDAVVDIYRARKAIKELKGLGCLFSLDDFGLGFSSLHYLRHLPVDYLKIDGSFIRSLLHSPTDQELVRFMVNMARTLGVKTVAEEVNNAATLGLVQGYGVDFAQGYYIGRPSRLRSCWTSTRESPDLCLSRRISRWPL